MISLVIAGFSTQAIAETPSYLLQWGTSGAGNGQFNQPWGLSVDGSGRVYVADYGNHRIQKFDSDGTYLGKWGSFGTGNGEFHHPIGVVVDVSGNVYVADYMNHRIQKFDASGAYLNQWGGFGSGPGQFKQPVDVAVDGSGNVYVADHVNNRVQKFDGSGGFLMQWGTEGSGPGQFSLPVNIVVDGAGNVYVVELNNPRAQKFDSNGVFLAQWGGFGSGNGQFSMPRGVEVDGSGNVYVVDYGNPRVQKFDGSGVYLIQWGRGGGNNGEFNGPAGAAVDSKGNIFVADTGNNRIQKFGATAHASAQTITFVSDPSWSAFDGDPALGSVTAVGPVQNVCCWGADLSAISGARWVWVPSVSGPTGGAELAEVFFSRVFLTTGPVTSASVHVAVDDLAEVIVNGTSVGTTGSITDRTPALGAQSALKQFDLMPFLTGGENRLTIRAQNGPGTFPGAPCNPCSYEQNPAGVVFGGALTFTPMPEVSISDVTAAEGNTVTTTFSFAVTIDSSSPEDLTIDFATADGSATVASGDYQAASGTVTISAGSTTTTITVQVNGDTRYEPDETFFVNLSNANGATIADGQGVGTILNDDPLTTVTAISPTGTVSPATPSVAVPVTLSRTDQTPILAYSVTLHLIDLTLGGSGIAEGPFLRSENPTTAFQVVDNGGGSYTIDAATLGSPCGSSALEGTLFTLNVGSSGASSTGFVSIDNVTLRDCGNQAIPASIGAEATVAVDYTSPAVMVTSPNGGESWPTNSQQAITWTATDDAGVASIDLAYSTDGGATYPHEIATGIANSGSYTWTVPSTPSAQARVRVTAHDAVGNTGTDASDANFTIRQYALTIIAVNGTVTKAPDQPVYVPGTVVTLTATAATGYHFENWSGDATGTANPTTVTMDSDKTVTAHFVVNPPVPPIKGLAVSQVKSGNDTDGTTKIQVTWPAVASGSVVEVYRAGYGHYPRYDDEGGAVPMPPSYPPGPPWTLTTVTEPGTTDEPSARDFWYYAAFVTDQYGTVSPVSNLAGGVLNYHLGDVADGVTPGQGNNVVDIADISLLGEHYGISGLPALAYDYLDVGPTTDRSVNGRPTTDGAINFEDLVMFALNYNAVAAPAALVRSQGPSGFDELTLSVTEASPDVLVAHLKVSGMGAIQALSITLTWNPSVVEPNGYSAGELLLSQGGVALSASPGMVDAALLGVRAQGLIGVGELATVSFRRLVPGNPGIDFQSATARNVSNQSIPLSTRRTTDVSGGSTVTSFALPSPNPFHSNTTLSFHLARSGPVELEILAVDGRRMRVLLQERREAGEHRVPWDGRNEMGQPVGAGVYYARLSTAMGEFRRKVVRLP